MPGRYMVGTAEASNSLDENGGAAWPMGWLTG
jgi:hypothetical protein